MDIVISQTLDRPIYEQIYEQIVIAIATGVLCINECLPSIRSMARELNVSVITTQKTYDKLENDGYIYTVQGKGCFISNRQSSLHNDKLRLAAEKLGGDVAYFISLGLSLDEAKNLLEDLWKHSK